MQLVQRLRRRVDAWQQHHVVPALLVGVVTKHRDDGGSQMAAALAYYGFLAVFPLMLILISGLGFILGGDPGLQHRLLHSALADFPVVGDQLRSSIHPLRGRGVGLLVGLVALLWGSLRVTQAAQTVMSTAWDVPRRERPGFLIRVGRGLGLLGVIGAGLAVTTLVGIGASVGAGAAIVATIIVPAGVNIGLYLAAFRLLTPPHIATARLVPGAVVGGIGWEILQLVGGYLVGHQLRHTTAVYGTFGIVLGLMSWLYLGAQLTVYAAELNVVVDTRRAPGAGAQPAPVPVEDGDARHERASLGVSRTADGGTAT